MQEIQLLLTENKKLLTLLQGIVACRNYQSRATTLESATQATDFWQNPEHATIMEELASLNNTLNLLDALAQKIAELEEFYALFSNDETQLLEIEKQLKQALKQSKKLKLNILLTGPYDRNPCFLSINPGAGGVESQDWAEMLLRMYCRFCEQHDFKYKIVDLQKGDQAGIKSAVISISSDAAYGIFKVENGVHRLVRISPFDASKRRHTSFASVHVVPEVPENQVHIASEDLKIDTFRSGGAGGQHVNTTDSAVRITHLPTGIVTQCQNERSQAQNKQQAMKFLLAKLIELEEQKRLNQQNLTEKKKIEWGSQIRSYVLHPYKMVKDHRTNWQSHQPEMMLDGNLMDAIEAFLQEDCTT